MRAGIHSLLCSLLSILDACRRDIADDVPGNSLSPSTSRPEPPSHVLYTVQDSRDCITLLISPMQTRI